MSILFISIAIGLSLASSLGWAQLNNCLQYAYTSKFWNSDKPKPGIANKLIRNELAAAHAMGVLLLSIPIVLFQPQNMSFTRIALCAWSFGYAFIFIVNTICTVHKPEVQADSVSQTESKSTALHQEPQSSTTAESETKAAEPQAQAQAENKSLEQSSMETDQAKKLESIVRQKIKDKLKISNPWDSLVKFDLKGSVQSIVSLCQLIQYNVSNLFGQYIVDLELNERGLRLFSGLPTSILDAVAVFNFILSTLGWRVWIIGILVCTVHADAGLVQSTVIFNALLELRILATTYLVQRSLNSSYDYTTVFRAVEKNVERHLCQEPEPVQHMYMMSVDDPENWNTFYPKVSIDCMVTSRPLYDLRWVEHTAIIYIDLYARLMYTLYVLCTLDMGISGAVCIAFCGLFTATRALHYLNATKYERSNVSKEDENGRYRFFRMCYDSFFQ